MTGTLFGNIKDHNSEAIRLWEYEPVPSVDDVRLYYKPHAGKGNGFDFYVLSRGIHDQKVLAHWEDETAVEILFHGLCRLH